VTEAARPAQAPRVRVSRAALWRVFFRSLFLQAAWNPRGMQNLGFADAMAPALDELYRDPAARGRATARHLEFFNCHPYLAAAILGGAVRLEEEAAAHGDDGRSVSAYKAALGPPFAALGDGLFWLALRPAAGLLAALTEPYLGLWCVAVFLVLYDTVHLAARVWLFFTGYRGGEMVVASVGRTHAPALTAGLKAAAAIMAGTLAARAVIVAAVPGRTAHGVLVGAVILAGVLALPRVSLSVALYVALGLGLALGGGFL
jgi:mannose PTS system EIID component